MIVRTVAAMCALGAMAVTMAEVRPEPDATTIPTYRVDPFWPKPLPNHWILGAVAGMAVDAKDHVWITHRPSTLQPNETRSIWKAAPPVLEFDQDGTLVSSWGGPGSGYEWPQLEHGIYVDARDRVWLAGGGDKDAQILEFTRDGRFVKQIGHQGKNSGSNDTANLGAAANIVVDETARELYVADGYVNHRVIVFDADTGAFKRMWGAFGNAPTPEMKPNPPVPQPQEPGTEGPQQFGLPHAVKVSNDGTVYVADRINNRIQLFTAAGKYLRTVRVTNEDAAVVPVPAGFSFSPDKQQQFLYVVDSGPMRVVVFDRKTMSQIGVVGMRGAGPGEFNIVHHMAADSKGNLYTAEIVTNRRAQRFVVQK